LRSEVSSFLDADFADCAESLATDEHRLTQIIFATKTQKTEGGGRTREDRRWRIEDGRRVSAP
jgi:hypothetical protein